MPKSKHHVLKADVAAVTADATSDIRLTVHLPLPEDHDTYKLIGRVAAEWAHLEHILDLTIWDMAGVREAAGSCITAQLPGSYARFNAIGALAVHRRFGTKMLDRIETLSNKVSGTGRERARIVHDAWYLEAGPDTTKQFKSILPRKKKEEGEQKFGNVDIGETYVTALIAKIRDRIKDVSQLRADILAVLRASS